MKSLIPWRSKQTATAPLSGASDWLERVWENPFTDLFAPLSRTASSRLPAVDVAEDKNEVKVRAEIPGMSEKDIDLSWHDGVLRIRGEKRNEKEEKKQGRYYSECSYGYFSRDIALGRDIDWQAAKARYKNGVLSVNLPKRADSRKVIEVKVS